MNRPLTVSFTYTKSMLLAMAKAEITLFHSAGKLLYQLGCMALIVAGIIAPLPEAWCLLLLMIGCLALPCLHLPPKMMVDRICQHYGDQFPTATYVFGHGSFTHRQGGNCHTINYSDVTQLSKDQDYLYIVGTGNALFFLETKAIGNRRAIEDFQKTMTQRTGKSWEPLGAILHLSLYELLRKKKV